MFRKADTAPQRRGFALTTSQIVEDVEAISSSEEQRNKLFLCLDEKVPREKKFTEMENFLKGTQKLQETSILLQGHIVKLQMLEKGLTSNMDEIESKMEKCQ